MLDLFYLAVEKMKVARTEDIKVKLAKRQKIAIDLDYFK
ncbi:hypothetical protein NIES4101_32160 [Calothrix sp. NIES-4101]|nr:hypothetical protein NIES4101_32160 [Calothrix sp. NIES-4101]